jgi:hypothetical protein
MKFGQRPGLRLDVVGSAPETLCIPYQRFDDCAGHGLGVFVRHIVRSWRMAIAIVLALLILWRGRFWTFWVWLWS